MTTAECWAGWLVGRLFAAEALPRDLRGARLQRAYLQGARLEGAEMAHAELWGAHLQDANLRNADLRGAILRDADLTGADLRDARLAWAVLRNADLTRATMMNATYDAHTWWPDGFAPAARGAVLTVEWNAPYGNVRPSMAFAAW